MHVWESGTSFDTDWPGHEMVKDENEDYTWHLNIPSELVGKSFKYIIHNNNGWKSNDPCTITINAEGNTVKGSTIGIN
jgi:1,4-alpha-glucan branching enzyme